MKTNWYKLRGVEYSTDFNFFKENQIVIVSSRGEDHYNSRLESFVFLIDVSNDDLEKMKMNLQKIHSNLLQGVYGNGEFVK